jgi:hypothetical protein
VLILRSRIQELTSALSVEREKTGAKTHLEVKGAKEIESTGPTHVARLRDFIRGRMASWKNSFLLRMDFFESKIATALDHMESRVGKLRTAYQDVAVLQTRRFPMRGRVPDTEDYIAHLGRGIRSMEAVSQVYARVHNFPAQKVPSVANLASNRDVVAQFTSTIQKSQLDRHLRDHLKDCIPRRPQR